MASDGCNAFKTATRYLLKNIAIIRTNGTQLPGMLNLAVTVVNSTPFSGKHLAEKQAILTRAVSHSPVDNGDNPKLENTPK